MRAAVSGLVLVVLGLLSGGAYAGEPDEVIVPGQEARVVALVRPVLERGGLSADVGLRIERAEIRIPLAGGRTPPGAAVILGRAGATPEGAQVPLAPGVQLLCTACSSEDVERLRPLGQALAEARDARAGDLWSRVERAPRPQKSAREELRHPLHRGSDRSPAFGAAVLGLALVPAITTLGGAVRALAGRAWLGALALLAASGLVRAAAPPQLLGVNVYGREIPALWQLARHELPLALVLPDGLNVFEQSMCFNAVVSTVTPLAILALALRLLRDAATAWWAAAAAAMCPMLASFGRSEDAAVGAQLAAVLAVTLFLDACESARPGRTLLAASGCLVWFGIALEARPPNAALVLVLAAVAWASGVRGRRVAVAAALVAATAALGVAAARNVARTTRVSDAPGVGSLYPSGSELGQLLVQLPQTAKVNWYFGAELFPLWLSLAAVLGLVIAWGTRRRTFVVLAGWFSVAFGAQLLVGASTPAIAARYGLSSVVPVLLAAGLGMAHLVARVRAASSGPHPVSLGAAAAGVFLAVASTAWSTRALGRVADDANSEYLFLERLWDEGAIPPGSAVIEAYARNEAPRFLHLGRRTRAGADEQVVQAFRGVVEHEGRLFRYDGLPCLWWQHEKPVLRETCGAPLPNHELRVVAERAVTEPLHDAGPGRRPAVGGVLRLYELIPRSR